MIDCLVHHRKCRTKFHTVVNQLQRSGGIKFGTLKRLPARCCSCNGQKPVVLEIDYTSLLALCREMQPSTQITCTIDTIVLPFDIALSQIQRDTKIGRFIGRQGVNIRALESTYKVSIQIVNTVSSAQLRTTVDHIKQSRLKTKTSFVEAVREIDGLWVAISVDPGQDESHVDDLKNALRRQWDCVKINTEEQGSVSFRQSRRRVRPRMCIQRKPKRPVITHRNKLKKSDEIEAVPLPNLGQWLMPNANKQQRHKLSQRNRRKQAPS